MTIRKMYLYLLGISRLPVFSCCQIRPEAGANLFL
jgi:hypothetical protein